MHSKSCVIVAAMLFLAVGVVFHGQAVAQTSKADVFTFTNPDGTPIPEDEREVVGSATLRRTASGLTIEVHTTGLGAEYAYTNWWIVFNNPEACVNGCDADDFGNPAVEASVLYATGRVSEADGTATFRAFLPVGLILLNRTEDGRERQRLGPGVQNPRTAEIHYIIRSHGPVAGDAAAEIIEKIGTFFGGCDGFACFDEQAIVFPLPKRH